MFQTSFKEITVMKFGRLFKSTVLLVMVAALMVSALSAYAAGPRVRVI